MHKGGKIILSLIIFVGLFTLPLFYNLGKVNAGPELYLDNPAMQQLTEYECVESTEYMKANHMTLLSDWREAVVRDGKSVYVNSQGKSFDISLQDTCLKCHESDVSSVSSNPVVLSNPALSTTEMSNPSLNASPQFCGSCHDYSAVQPQCWTCHFEPTKEAVK